MTTIFVTWAASGFHCWPNATGAREYLSAPHRHLFVFKLEMDVWNGDREVEFHDVLDWCRIQTPDDADWGSASCEDIAHMLLGGAARKWPGRKIRVTVSEDGECGATVR